MKIIGYIVTAILLWVYGAVLHGWVLTKLWAWFVVPTFALPSLSLPAAIGISITVNYQHEREYPLPLGGGMKANMLKNPLWKQEQKAGLENKLSIPMGSRELTLGEIEPL